MLRLEKISVKFISVLPIMRHFRDPQLLDFAAPFFGVVSKSFLSLFVTLTEMLMIPKRGLLRKTSLCRQLIMVVIWQVCKHCRGSTRHLNETLLLLKKRFLLSHVNG